MAYLLLLRLGISTLAILKAIPWLSQGFRGQDAQIPRSMRNGEGSEGKDSKSHPSGLKPAERRRGFTLRWLGKSLQTTRKSQENMDKASVNEVLVKKQNLYIYIDIYIYMGIFTLPGG